MAKVSLEQIQAPADLRQLDMRELRDITSQLREFVLRSVSQTGGHLSSNLGTVELTSALHYVFETPHDRIVWDVGHQSYAHKILTGRREQMAGLRQFGGISGFPKRSESEYDDFGTAHSSTSISAVLGMAVASRNAGIKRQHIAVIGDGAMTAGMAFEALNNAGVTPGVNVLVILNDNDMSISPPVGALNRYLARLMSGQFYARAKNVGKAVLQHVPPVLDLARKFEGHAKGILSPATLFEELGFNYVGPIDGHDLDALVPTLQNLRELGGLQFLHVVTRKGQGYKLAEADPVLYHGPGKFDPDVGIVKSSEPQKISFTQVFGQWLCDMAAHDERLYGITPAMREGSGMVEFEQRFPTRYFDVGIAEQHAVTFAAGLACEGQKPVVAIYSTFLQRGYDQLIHDVALQNLDVTFALDRAGLVGADGATHAGNYDIAFLRCVPNMVIATPSDEQETRCLLSTCYQHPGPAAVRYPRGNGVGKPVQPNLASVELGKAKVVRMGKAIALLAFGPILYEAAKVAEKFNLTLIDMRFVKPLDTGLLQELAQTHMGFVTLEEAALMGGAGSAVLEYFSAADITVPVLTLGYPDEFIDHGDQKRLAANLGLVAEGIERSITERFSDLLEA
ncbi:1-deoxy-D-xylulose-5-phosphate synthase [Alcaligenes endophyticus]|uniref:1-deoxy-D-xylulose-5-phosphate synthase n=1 Tax=Alcaligenes endophyticus TaxID=1929088 RepID=A0ABT8ENE1_9BURK|nr:1-deoxy-D-xylulose-5-phosphate synthase [Alcaligenes endophyticus]MCX5591335.1 1-deoxy-D-xylulose-5-phosphate synthase [Alcaligenes endophyticus]MDN4122784.1 1-deoxy-D-xylulose-5-phosphate synthase [Alcaligenes endophyticus]